jgi:hypothetical protein
MDHTVAIGANDSEIGEPCLHWAGERAQRLEMVYFAAPISYVSRFSKFVAATLANQHAKPLTHLPLFRAD